MRNTFCYRKALVQKIQKCRRKSCVSHEVLPVFPVGLQSSIRSFIKARSQEDIMSLRDLVREKTQERRHRKPVRLPEPSFLPSFLGHFFRVTVMAGGDLGSGPGQMLFLLGLWDERTYWKTPEAWCGLSLALH